MPVVAMSPLTLINPVSDSGHSSELLCFGRRGLNSASEDPSSAELCSLGLGGEEGQSRVQLFPRGCWEEGQAGRDKTLMLTAFSVPMDTVHCLRH
jgi:hypothetical protein